MDLKLTASQEALLGFSYALLQAREGKGLVQQELADLIGCDPSFITKLEGAAHGKFRNVALPGALTARRLEEALGLERDFLWGKIVAAKREQDTERALVKFLELSLGHEAAALVKDTALRFMPTVAEGFARSVALDAAARNALHSAGST